MRMVCTRVQKIDEGKFRLFIDKNNRTRMPNEADEKALELAEEKADALSTIRNWEVINLARNSIEHY